MTRRLLAPLLACTILAASSAALLAQADDGPAVAAEAAPADVGDVAAAPSSPAPAAGEAAAGVDMEQPTVAELLAELAALRQKHEDRAASGDDAERRLLLFGMLASGTWILIGLAKILSAKVRSQWRRYTVPIVGGLSVAAALFTGLSGGMSWPDAVIVGAGASISTFLHELKRAFLEPT